MRNPVAAGQFYPLSSDNLRGQLDSFLSPLTPSSSLAAVSPHAGYTYSGQTAAYSLSGIGQADTYLLIGPNHQGLGSEIAVSTEDWSTPLGEIQVNGSLANKIISSTQAEDDALAHQYEHSLEVQLPFLQHLYTNFQIVPISMLQSSLDPASYESFGSRLAQIIRDETKTIKIIASSDFSHQVPLTQARENDRAAIEFIKSLNVKGFLSYVSQNQVSICGYGPIATAMSICRNLGIKKGELLKYETSASATSDDSSVVGYASIIFK